MKANELGVPTFEVSVSCGTYCLGGSANFQPTTYPEFTEADEVWVKGADVAAIAARLAVEEAHGEKYQRELRELRTRLAEAKRLLRESAPFASLKLCTEIVAFLGATDSADACINCGRPGGTGPCRRCEFQAETADVGQGESNA